MNPTFTVYEAWLVSMGYGVGYGFAQKSVIAGVATGALMFGVQLLMRSVQAGVGRWLARRALARCSEVRERP